MARGLAALDMTVCAVRASITHSYSDGPVTVHPLTGIAASRYPFHELPNVVISPHRGGGFSMPGSGSVVLGQSSRR